MMSQKKEAVENQESLKAIAEMYGVDIDEVWRSINEGYVSPELVQPAESWKTRTQISANVTQEQRDALQAIAAAEGLSWSELCGRLADGKLAVKSVSD
jgi:hypothetical protein